MDVRKNERDQKIDEHDGINSIEKNGCEYLKRHVDLMYQLKGEHLIDIPYYINRLDSLGCPDLERSKMNWMFEKIGLDINYNPNHEQLKKTFFQICDLVKKYVKTNPIDGIFRPRLVTLYNTLNSMRYADVDMQNEIKDILKSQEEYNKQYLEQKKKIKEMEYLDEMKKLQTDFYLEKMKQLQSQGLQAAGAHRKSKKSKKSKRSKKTKSRRH